MVSAKTLCKKLLNVKGCVIENLKILKCKSKFQFWVLRTEFSLAEIG